MSRFLLLIPVFNAIKSVDKVVYECSILVRNNDIEILIVDNCSTDGTYETLSQRIIGKNSNQNKITIQQNVRNLGLGGSLKFNMINNIKHYDWFLVAHGDGQGDINKICANFIDTIKINPKLNFIMASRFHKDANLEGYNRVRKMANKALNLFSRIILNIKISDFGCGIIAIRTDVIDGLNFDTLKDDFMFNPELNVRIASDPKIVWEEIPLDWKDSINPSNVSVVSHTMAFLRYVIRFKTQRNGGIYGILDK